MQLGGNFNPGSCKAVLSPAGQTHAPHNTPKINTLPLVPGDILLKGSLHLDQVLLQVYRSVVIFGLREKTVNINNTSMQTMLVISHTPRGLQDNQPDSLLCDPAVIQSEIRPHNED